MNLSSYTTEQSFERWLVIAKLIAKLVIYCRTAVLCDLDDEMDMESSSTPTRIIIADHVHATHDSSRRPSFMSNSSSKVPVVPGMDYIGAAYAYTPPASPRRRSPSTQELHNILSNHMGSSGIIHNAHGGSSSYASNNGRAPASHDQQHNVMGASGNSGSSQLNVQDLVLLPHEYQRQQRIQRVLDEQEQEFKMERLRVNSSE
jgi:hypothetical protein